MVSDEKSDLDWKELSSTYLSRYSVAEPVAELIASFESTHPLEHTTALNRDHARRFKADSAGFLLFAIRQAVTDHVLTDEEVRSLRQVSLLLRVDEGDLLRQNEPEVVELLTKEIKHLLLDQEIDATEALHKVKLQELLGLGYDEFVTLTAPEVEQVIRELISYLDLQSAQDSHSVEWFLDRVSALDTVYDLNPEMSSHFGGGHLYLLMNPAMPGLIKVGHTTRATEARMSELTGATGVPLPFVLVYELSVADAPEAERFVHDRLDQLGYRVAQNREFFNAPPSLAVELMLQARNSVGA